MSQEPHEDNYDNLNQVELTEEEQQAIMELDMLRFYKKGTILVREGQVSLKSFHVLKGCVRQYYIVDGEERTTFFFTEDQSILPASSVVKKNPSKHYLQCLEDSKLSEASFEQDRALCKRFPRFEAMCRARTEEQIVEYQEMLSSYIMSSPEQRYLRLLETQPGLINRVPQYQLASYLGVKPESLSRIRKRIASK